MADELTVTLRASAAETAPSGNGATIDLREDGVELRNLAEVTLNVTALGSGGLLTVTIQTSTDGVLWSSLSSFPRANITGRQVMRIGDLERYVRISWALSGTTPTATFSVSATAFSVFACMRDIESHGVVAEVVASLPQETRIAALLAADGQVRGYVARHATGPIKSVGFDVRANTAKLAAFDLLVNQVGFDPDQRHHTMLAAQHEEILRWLRADVGGGKYTIGQSVVDDTPDDVEGFGAVETPEPLGWGANGVL